MAAHRIDAKFVQIMAAGDTGPETLFALDEDGNVWQESGMWMKDGEKSHAHDPDSNFVQQWKPYYSERTL